jgi:hypothetical protein
MATRHNLCTNPALKNNNTGWGGGSAPARSTGLTGFPDRATGASYTSGTFMTGPVAAVTAGQTITFSIYARSNSFNVNSGTIYIQWNDASTVSTGYTLTAGVVKRVSLTATVPAGKTSAQLVMDGQNYASSSGDYTELLYEVAGSADAYFDGDSASASWDGADGNSASTFATSMTGTAADTIAITDSPARTSVLPRATSETIAISDSVSRHAITARATADTVTVSDSPASHVATARATSDTITITDSATAVMIQSRATADTITVTDSPARTRTMQRTAADTVTITDAVSVAGQIIDLTAIARAPAGGWRARAPH